jgi:hemerythrin-like metal-binding protein
MNDVLTPKTLEWSDGLLLGYGPMDSVHQEFVECVSSLTKATEVDMAEKMSQLITHVRHHFDEENSWMIETNFPAKECHIDEHAAVLKSIMEVNDLVLKGDNSQCLRLSKALMDWFPGHADYLDSALSHWMCKQRLGGKPVVVRRFNSFGNNNFINVAKET